MAREARNNYREQENDSREVENDFREAITHNSHVKSHLGIGLVSETLKKRTSGDAVTPLSEVLRNWELSLRVRSLWGLGGEGRRGRRPAAGAAERRTEEGSAGRGGMRREE